MYKVQSGEVIFFLFLTLNTEVTSPEVVTAVEFFYFHKREMHWKNKKIKAVMGIVVIITLSSNCELYV